MSKKIIAVNAGPRKGWNTDTLIDEAIKGAESTGAEVKKFNLFRLEKYTGCISCFGCKKIKYKGHCIRRDGLSDLTASFRALYERLIFQNLTYNAEVPCCNENPIPTLIIMTCNGREDFYTELMENYKNIFNIFVGPTEYFVSGETQQLKDYSKTDWEWYFDAEERYKRHETIFPKERKAAFEKGKELVK